MKWEYRFSEFRLDRGVRIHEEALNEFGLEGWEVVAVWPEPKGDGRTQRCLLKRELPPREALKRSGRKYLKLLRIYRGTEH